MLRRISSELVQRGEDALAAELLGVIHRMKRKSAAGAVFDGGEES